MSMEFFPTERKEQWQSDRHIETEAGSIALPFDLLRLLISFLLTIAPVYNRVLIMCLKYQRAIFSFLSFAGIIVLFRRMKHYYYRQVVDNERRVYEDKFEKRIKNVTWLTGLPLKGMLLSAIETICGK